MPLTSEAQVVPGAGDEDADVMFVGEAPGAIEERLGVPLAGRAGVLLDELLAGVGLARADVFVTNVLLCRPPGNRTPLPGEIAGAESDLLETIERVRPVVVCPLGNFATKLLRSDPTPITRLHGQAEVRTLASRAVRLLPLFHPAAALYQDAQVEVLRRDFAQIPALVAAGVPEQPAPPAPVPLAEPEQLGLF